MALLSDTMLLLRKLRDARAPLVMIFTILLIAINLVPAITAIVLALLVDRLNNATGSDTFSAAMVPLIAFGLMLLIGHFAEAASAPLEYLAKSRIDGAHRARLMRLTSQVPTIDQLEDPEVQKVIREVSADPRNRSEHTPGDGALSQIHFGAGLLGLLVACVVLAFYSWWLIPLLVIPAATIRYLQSKRALGIVGNLRLAYKEEMHADVWRQATISPGASKDIRIFGFADWMVERMQGHIATGNAPLWNSLIAYVKGEWRTLILMLLGLAPAYAVVTYSAAQGQTPIAVQTAVFAAGWAVFQALGALEHVQRIVGATAVVKSFDRLHGMLESAQTPAVQDLAGGNQPPLVRFEDVSFSYANSPRTVLDGLSLEIRPGELLAIVGANGAGKSTLIKLLAGLYTPTSGVITADGTDIATVAPDVWRGRISVVFQDFVRYPLSAGDNIVLGKAAAPPDMALADEASRDAGFEDVRARLPNGWETPLARSRTGGVDLSGGQWQQVVLARALYAVKAGARVLVLDEPTAHLDVRTEFEVFGRLSKHRGDTSVVLISHRLSTVRQADRIVFLDQGRVTECGTHEELIALGGGYAEMFAIQAERFRHGFDDRIEEGELL